MFINCRHGDYLALLLNRRWNIWKKDNLLDNYRSKINDGKWSGKAAVPWEYIPDGVDKINAYAIHGCENNRTYEALHSASPNQYSYPDL